jgi:hypothetical protein
MRGWLRSKAVSDASKSTDWPTPETADPWRAFVLSMEGESIRKWQIHTKSFPMKWKSRSRNGCMAGALVRVMNRTATTRTKICAPDFTPLGELPYRLRVSRTSIMYGTLAPEGATVDVTYIGPGDLR